MIALYFGSFNPIHNGHVSVARYVVECGLADKVWLVVSPQNPHKQSADLAPEEHRLAMARLAVAEYDELEVCDVEFSMPRPSYTVHTIDTLRERYPSEEFALLGGGDVAATIHTWREGERLLAENKILIYPRGENDHFGEPFVMMGGAPKMKVSSTQVRELIKSGGEWHHDVPPQVAEYIEKHKLYMEHKTLEEALAAGKEAYARNNFGEAINHFGEAKRLAPDNKEADQWLTMIDEILAFRHKDYYNP
jgi:nicotinate-nucleotide adenylyltransferase